MAEKKENKAVAVITLEQVNQLIATALAAHSASLATMIEGVVTEVVSKTMEASLGGFITAEEAKSLFNEAFSGMIVGEFLPPVTGIIGEVAAPALPPLDPSWLDGLTFNGVNRSVIKEKGQRPKAVSKPFSRPLTPEDVLSYFVGEAAVTLVSADGKKHTVEI